MATEEDMRSTAEVIEFYDLVPRVFTEVIVGLVFPSVLIVK